MRLQRIRVGIESYCCYSIGCRECWRCFRFQKRVILEGRWGLRASDEFSCDETYLLNLFAFPVTTSHYLSRRLNRKTHRIERRNRGEGGNGDGDGDGDGERVAS